MKLSAFLFVVFLSFAGVTASGQARVCIVKGDLGPIAPYVLKAFIQYKPGDLGAFTMKIDSGEVVDGKYTLKAVFDHPSPAFIVLRLNKARIASEGYKLPGDPDAVRVLTFFPDNGSVIIRTSSFPMSGSVVEGSAADRAAKVLLGQTRALSARADSLRGVLNAAVKAGTPPPEQTIKVLQATYKGLFSAYAKSVSAAGCPIAAYITGQAGYQARSNWAPADALVRSFYAAMNPRFRKTAYGEEYRRIMDFSPGIAAPEFTRRGANGDTVSLRKLRGSYVLIDFWGSWCTPCRAENPFMVELYEKFKGQKFEIVGVARETVNEEGRRAWLSAIAQDKLPWPNVLSEETVTGGMLDKVYHVDRYPMNFLVGPDGKLLAKNLRGKSLWAELEKLFGR